MSRLQAFHPRTMAATLRETFTRHRATVLPTVLSMGGSGITAFSSLLIASLIGAEQFGGMSVVQSVAVVLMIPALMSLNYVMYQTLPRQNREDHPATITTAVMANFMGMALLSVLAVLGQSMAAWFLKVDTSLLWFCLLLASSLGFYSLTESFLRGAGRFILVAWMKCGFALGYLCIACFLLFGAEIKDFRVYLGVMIGCNLLYSLLVLFMVPLRPRSFSIRLAFRFYGHGLWVTIITVLSTLCFSLDIIMLNQFHDSQVVGNYAAYNNLPKRLLGIFLTDGLGMVLLPTFATLEKTALLKTVRRIAPWLCLGAGIGSFLLASLLFVFLQNGYHYSAALMAISAVGIGTHAVFNLYFSVLTMDGKRGARAIALSLLIGLVPLLGCQLLLVATLGLRGGLLAFIVSNLVLIVIMNLVNQRVYRQQPAPAEEPESLPTPSPGAIT